MIHSGHGVISHYYKKAKVQVTFFVLILLCLIFIVTSCGGSIYTFDISSEMSETDLSSIEVVLITFVGSPLECETIMFIDDEDEKDKIVDTLSKMEFQAKTVPASDYFKYAFKLNYPDKCVIASPGNIYITDVELNYVSIKDKGFHDVVGNSVGTLLSMLENYISSEDMANGWECVGECTRT